MSTQANPTLTGAPWRTSSYSNGNGGNCVEVADLDEHRAVRDSKNPAGPALLCATAGWAAFTAGLKSGGFS